MKPTLGSCYYPEHWPQQQWADDAQRMIDAGLTVVRIGEFSWSRLEPKPGKMEWEWLDRAIEILGSAGLSIVLGTPTATPPRWMLDKHPEMLAVDANDDLRKFGSRRHYCFSYLPYREESARIATLMAERYGQSPHVIAWQTDNEYGCHDTVVSYSDAARNGFRRWLEQRYSTIDQLNIAWGNIFWSMEYESFAQVDLPHLTVTEANPAHCMDFRRFSSDQVVAYNLAQVEAIRKHSDMPLVHNYMGRIIDFDHFKLGEDLQISSWDAYPLGFLEDRSDTDEDWKMRFYRQGDPDFQAFHHDIYRAVGRGRWWIMEQQPGPVNWAPHNPAPLPGMVRLWTLEAIAHQAETVCYFRWRQAPFAQEQMHAGLLRPDSQESVVMEEVRQVSADLAELDEIRHGKAKVALLFDYESCWAWETQPQGEDFDYFSLAFDFYRNLRRLGLSVDILPPNTSNFDDYKLVLIPGLMHWTEQQKAALEKNRGLIIVGPRSGSKTVDFQIPESLPPAIPNLDIRVQYVESLRPGVVRPIKDGGGIRSWLETIEGGETVIESLSTGEPVLVGGQNLQYLAAWPTADAMQRILKRACHDQGIATRELPEGLRIRATASHEFIMNYNAEDVEFEGQSFAPAAVRWRTI